MRYRAVALLMLIAALPFAGCARSGGTGGQNIPNLLVRFLLRYAGPVNDTAHYYIAIDADDDYGVDGPLPVAAGPFWGNAWGTGSMTHFVRYTQGSYNVFIARRQIQFDAPGGGIVDAVGSPDETDTGDYVLTVGAVTLGAATVSGTGPVTAVASNSGQNAGTFQFDTDAAGDTVAGSVSFASAANGGRPVTAAEQADLDALNAGGVTVAPNSLDAFGLTLTIGAPAAGTQQIDVAPTVADVTADFSPTGGGGARQTLGTVTANSNTPTATPPVPGVAIETETLVAGGVALLRSLTSPDLALLGFPYEADEPFGTSTLDVTLDIGTLAANVDHLTVNFISTDELIFDPILTDPDLNVYDGLGVQGNDYVTFSTRQSQTIRNAQSFTPEAGGDPTLRGNVTQAERDAVDLIDWTIIVRVL